MPDPLLYLGGIAASVCVSAALVLIIGRRASRDSLRGRWASLLALGCGLAAGDLALRLLPRCPPANGLDRFLTIVLPAAFLIELPAAAGGVPRRLVTLLRFALAVAIGPILLYGSVYLDGPHRQWTTSEASLILGAAAAALVVVWQLLERLEERSSGAAVPVALALTLQSAGLAIMLAGYLKGGAAAFPIAASLAGVALASRGLSQSASLPSPLGVAVVSLYGILLIGRFFGGLSTGTALVMLLAPLAAWIAEFPPLRPRTPRLLGALQILLTAIPLLAVLGLAARDFVQRTLPLL